MEPKSAAVKHVAAPVEPVLAPVDKGPQSLEAPEALSFSRGLAFSPSGATTLPHINYACFGLKPYIYNCRILLNVYDEICNTYMYVRCFGTVHIRKARLFDKIK